MADGYVKILASILDSSIWAEDSDLCKVWITLLAMADRDGYVGASVGGITNRSRTVSREKVQQALELFQQPDEDSRTEDFEGRRIQKVDRGYLILNYKKIRDMHGAEAVKASKRQWWAANRSKAAAAAELEPETSSLEQLEPLDSSHLARRKPMDPGSGSSDLSESDARAMQIPCPSNLKLTSDQRGVLETSLVPGWAIDEITKAAVASYAADQTDKRPLVAWRKCLAKAIAGSWNDPRRRPKKPPEERKLGSNGKPVMTAKEAGLPGA